ncbi:MAG: hypothetical protein IKV03_00980 [Alphaproteobacteria bacterium]|nr:hypothetical protein [Alphaproteobacteria bacterium]
MKKIYISLIVSSLFFSSLSWAICPKNTPNIRITASQGSIKYITNMARKDFIAKYPGTPNTTLGLTVANLQVKMTGEPNISQTARQTCVGLKEVNFQIGYDNILVYIHKDYKPGSCQYRVVKDHENYHVNVHRQAISFFKPDIETVLRKAVAKLKPERVNSSNQAQQVVNKQFAQIQKEIAPLLNHINVKIREKNAAIDTPESYKATSKLCKSW